MHHLQGMAFLRDHGQPLRIALLVDAEVDHEIALLVVGLVVADDRAARDHVVLVDDGVADAAVFADVDVGQQDAVMDGGVAVDEDLVEQDRVGDRAAGDDAAVADDGVDGPTDAREAVGVDLLVVDELGGGQAVVVVVDRPERIVEVEVRRGAAQVHVRLEIRLQGPDVAPVGLRGEVLAGDHVRVEIVGVEAFRLRRRGASSSRGRG